MAVRLIALIATAILALMTLDGGRAAAQRTFTGPASNVASDAGEARAAPGLIDRVSAAIRVQQQRFYRELGGAVRALKSGYSGPAAFALIAIAFVYGVFHAAGPGHGKAVISAYMLANERSIRRGIILSTLAAFAQALTAIVLVYGLLLLLSAAGRRVQLVARDLEIASYAMIAALGAFLLWRATRPLFVSLLTGPAPAIAGGPGTGPACAHGHSHTPDPILLDRPLTLRTALPIVASIGLRPCSGAIVVLIFAHSLSLHGAGIAATFAMAVGTAITVAVLASLAVGSRELAAALIGHERRATRLFHRAVAIGGSGLVLALGLVLLHGALTAPARPFM